MSVVTTTPTQPTAAPTAPRMPNPAAAGGYDLKTFLRSAGSRPRGAFAAPEDRKDSDVAVEVILPGAAQVTAEPAPVFAYIDGVQNQMLVTYRHHRPIVLAYVAAGAAGAGASLLGVRETLAIVCAEADLDWVAEVNPADKPIPVQVVTGATPPEVERSAMGRVQLLRADAEKQLTADLLDHGNRSDLIVVDGSLLGRVADPRLVGVVKTTRTKYLTDETSLYGLPAGWRSAVFRIDAVGQTPPRYSTYVRLHPAVDGSWSFGLIRLESFDPDLLEPMAARAYAERQGPHSGDGRWDRHLVSVATCEKLLRARRPVVFELLGAGA